MNTLLLDRTVWDVCLDAAGNIAMASNPYAVAQDVASAIKLFRGELFYDTAKGIPYWTEVLGQLPPLALVRERLRAAALTVPEVADAVPTITAFENRRLSGYVEVTLTNGTTSTITF
ncbi:hypothetical protein OII53_28015 [Achromobacter ruhlandii]|uniref:hypothetical protein n=1 Tax=Achromobacter ruhlandii TaxID=72557 RepID=UPI0021F2089D|nr:hypothetical protein [Achromobacter ruhlandii]MCV6799833.1 hypothetical protein [Achromobacter ruhlandii]MCV6801457.1 hypothetical protein [Achromobacter ruhlandii]MCV6812308.1 hypothetical protein [Achromobacter ruhlandii]MCV6822421.1 hypothetical protein [Achromobacter ruhlandii]